MEGFCCNQTIPIAFDINFTSLLNSVGDMGRIDRVGPQHFGAGQKKNGRGRNFGVGET